jgi:hypothetical protein
MLDITFWAVACRLAHVLHDVTVVLLMLTGGQLVTRSSKSLA